MVNRGIALFACFFQVSANRISYQVAFAGIVKILQDAIDLSLLFLFPCSC
ncbi:MULTISPECIES: DMT family protein [Pectobacterium]